MHQTSHYQVGRSDASSLHLDLTEQQGDWTDPHALDIVVDAVAGTLEVAPPGPLAGSYSCFEVH